MINPSGINLLKVNNRNTSTRYEICSKLTIKTPIIANVEHISRLVLVFSEHVISGWVETDNKIGRH